jgi:hypothetical protein
MSIVGYTKAFSLHPHWNSRELCQHLEVLESRHSLKLSSIFLFHAGKIYAVKEDELVKSRERRRHSKKLQMQVERSEIPLAGARPSTSSG